MNEICPLATLLNISSFTYSNTLVDYVVSFWFKVSPKDLRMFSTAYFLEATWTVPWRLDFVVRTVISEKFDVRHVSSMRFPA